MQKITPFLWFDGKAEEAAKFYTNTFSNSKILSSSPMITAFEIEGMNFTALNGGPQFRFSPAISFFVYCKTEKEINELFSKLSAGGQIRMPLNKYPFSERYAFFDDKYGVSWQIILADSKQKIVPCLLFVGKQEKNAEKAIKIYTKVFKNSTIRSLAKYGAGEIGTKGTVKHAQFSLEGQEFRAMSGAGPHTFEFTEATSFLVDCKDQKEIDYFWTKLSSGGSKGQCGWLKDKFGVSWQIVPSVLRSLMGKDTSGKVMKAMLTMKKLDIKKLEHAYNTKN